MYLSWTVCCMDMSQICCLLWLVVDHLPKRKLNICTYMYIAMESCNQLVILPCSEDSHKIRECGQNILVGCNTYDVYSHVDG